MGKTKQRDVKSKEGKAKKYRPIKKHFVDFENSEDEQMAQSDMSFDDGSSDEEQIAAPKGNKNKRQPPEESLQEESFDSGSSEEDEEVEMPPKKKIKTKHMTFAERLAMEESQAAAVEDESDDENGGSDVNEDKDDVKPQSSTYSEMKRLKAEISKLTPLEKQKLKSQLGLEIYNEIVLGQGKQGKKMNRTDKYRSFPKASKSDPTEMSSKRKVKPLMTSGKNIAKRQSRDPRFDNLSGEFNEEFYEENYAFLEDIKKEEKKKMQKVLKKTTDVEERMDLKKNLKKLQQEERLNKKKKSQENLKKKIKEKEKELIAQGKRPYHIKKSQLREIELAEQFKDLKESGKLQSYMMKKRKHTASKQRKQLPGQRVPSH